jgi:hypothetical protein
VGDHDVPSPRCFQEIQDIPLVVRSRAITWKQVAGHRLMSGLNEGVTNGAAVLAGDENF